MGHLSNLATDTAVNEVILHKNVTYERSEGNDIRASLRCLSMLQDKLALIKRQQTASCEPTDIGVMVLLQLQQ
jgi:hypothetical protein